MAPTQERISLDVHAEYACMTTFMNEYEPKGTRAYDLYTHTCVDAGAHSVAAVDVHHQTRSEAWR